MIVSSDRNQMTSINDLSNELLLKIFQFLSLKERLLCRHVCVKWRSLALKCIGQLVVGHRISKPFGSVYSDYGQINHPIDAKLFEICHTVLTESGRSLKNLYLNRFSIGQKPSIESNISEDAERAVSHALWLDHTIDSLITNCSNLTSLHIDSGREFLSIDKTLLILKHVGNQLDELYTPFVCPLSFDEFKSYLNPKMRKLSIAISNSDQLVRLVNQCPQLTHFKLRVYDHVDLDHLHLLPNLKFFFLAQEPDLANLRSLTRQPMSQTLHALGFLHNHGLGASQLSLLGNLNALRMLHITVNFGNQLDAIVDGLPRLEALFIDHMPAGLDPGYKQSILKLPQLKHLNTLILFERSKFLSESELHKLNSMLSVKVFVLRTGWFENALEDHELMLKSLPKIFPHLEQLRLHCIRLRLDSLIECLGKLKALIKLQICSSFEGDHNHSFWAVLESFCFDHKIMLKSQELEEVDMIRHELF